MYDPSLSANITLILWVPVLILTAVRLHPTKAFSILFIAGELFLPELASFKPIILPPFGKTAITSFWILSMALLRYREKLSVARLSSGPAILFIIFLIGQIATVLTNRDTLTIGPTVLSALTINEITHYTIIAILFVASPFLIGCAFLRTSDEIVSLFKIITIFALIYTLFIIVELRMSPQFHKWIYGYRQHSFRQVVRFGGYRPMVFMEHGLALALFIAISVFSSQLLDKIRTPLFHLPKKAVTSYLFIILILCKSTAAIIYGAIFLPILAFFKPKTIIRMGAIIGLFSIVYPALRITDAFPEERILNLLSFTGDERQGSLAFRFYNENLMAERTLERPLFGWGGHSRGRAYDKKGREISVIDSYWIGVFTNSGLVGMYCVFGILVLPLILAYRNLKRIEPRKAIVVAGLSLILAVSVVDLLINGLFTLLPFLFAGSLYGSISELTKK